VFFLDFRSFLFIISSSARLPALLCLATLRAMSGTVFDSALEKVGKLSATFKANESSYLSPGYRSNL